MVEHNFLKRKYFIKIYIFLNNNLPKKLSNLQKEFCGRVDKISDL